MLSISLRAPLRQLNSLGRRYASGAIKYKYQDQLFIIPKSGGALISFSQNPSSVSIGSLVELPKDESELTTLKIENSNFEENKEFLKILHKLLNDKVHEDFVYKTEAGPAPNSNLAIYDFRGAPPYGRTPDVDNVFGYVRVNEEGDIIPHSYEVNPMYRLLNDSEGLITLSDFLLEELLKEID